MQKTKIKICRVATVPFFLRNHLRGQILATIQAGFDVSVITSAGADLANLLEVQDLKVHEIEIPRSIQVFNDLNALWQLYKLFRKEHFDIVHSVTPKAGLLCSIAALLAGVSTRIHTFTGQPWVELEGILKFVAKLADKLIVFFNTQCYTDSFSQKDFLISQQIGNNASLAVLGNGSLAGVDCERFKSENWIKQRNSIKRDLHIPDSTFVITFIGRLTKDKGIVELVSAFSKLKFANRNCILLLVGPMEPDRDPLPEETILEINSNPSIRSVGYSVCPEQFLSITDIFCLPSYREGFGNVIIEAAAMGVPAVGSDIVGLRDAVVDGETGILVPVKNVDNLFFALIMLIDDNKLRKSMGRKACERVRHQFSSEFVNLMVIREYERLIDLHR